MSTSKRFVYKCFNHVLNEKTLILKRIQYATYTLDYPLSTQVPREDDSFGLDIAGRLMLVAAENFQPMIDEMSAAYSVPQ